MGSWAVSGPTDDFRSPCPPSGPEKRNRRWLPPMPRWFRRWIWRWVFLMSCVALAGYIMTVFRGTWTPEHLLRLLIGGL